MFNLKEAVLPSSTVLIVCVPKESATGEIFNTFCSSILQAIPQPVQIGYLPSPKVGITHVRRDPRRIIPPN